MGEKVLNINVPALKAKLREAPQKAFSKLMKTAEATRKQAVAKALSSGIALTKKQLATLEKFQKQTGTPRAKKINKDTTNQN